MASKKKGLSVDEKRERLLQLFYDSKEFFQMRELEKIAPKRKGIVSQSVKEITQMLVDDGLIECEKIGTFVCYWAFPSKAALTRKTRLENLESNIADVKTKLDSVKESIEKAKIGREEGKERSDLLSRLSQATARRDELKRTVDDLAESDTQFKEEIRFDFQRLQERERAEADAAENQSEMSNANQQPSTPSQPIHIIRSMRADRPSQQSVRNRIAAASTPRREARRRSLPPSLKGYKERQEATEKMSQEQSSVECSEQGSKQRDGQRMEVISEGSLRPLSRATIDEE